MQAHREETLNNASIAAEGILNGTLTFKQVLGVSDHEMQAIQHLAERHVEERKPRKALDLYILLATYDPICPDYWEAMGDVLRRIGSYGDALACYETVALLKGREVSVLRREAECVERLGQPSVAKQLRAYAKVVAQTKTGYGAH